MKKQIKYIARGMVNVNGIPVDINEVHIEAYSRKQAFLILAFKIKGNFNDNVNISMIYHALHKSSVILSIVN